MCTDMHETQVPGRLGKKVAGVHDIRLLDKLGVICPHSDSCKEVSQRGILEDHLRYRCEGTLVACQYAGAGCTFRGPNKKVRDHQNDCQYKKEGRWQFPGFIATLMILSFFQENMI